MTTLSRAFLVLRAFYELLRFDVLQSVFAIPGVAHRLPGRPAAGLDVRSAERERAIIDAVTLAMCLYWKPVPCLQRAVCLVRVLRAHRIDAVVVIGYRSMPFQSHAWVEIQNRVVNESRAYRERWRVLRVA